jgi:hypothetical protein
MLSFMLLVATMGTAMHHSGGTSLYSYKQIGAHLTITGNSSSFTLEQRTTDVCSFDGHFELHLHSHDHVAMNVELSMLLPACSAEVMCDEDLLQYHWLIDDAQVRHHAHWKYDSSTHHFIVKTYVPSTAYTLVIGTIHNDRKTLRQGVDVRINSRPCHDFSIVMKAVKICSIISWSIIFLCIAAACVLEFAKKREVRANVSFVPLASDHDII